MAVDNVPVSGAHQLRRFNAFPVFVQGYQFACLEHARHFSGMLQSGYFEQAHEYRLYPGVFLNPPVSASLPEQLGAKPDARWTIFGYDVMKDIILDQMENPASEFTQAFLELVMELGGPTPNFVGCGADLVWTCGLRTNQVLNGQVRRVCGYDHYGQIPNEVFDTMLNLPPARWGVQQLFDWPIQAARNEWPWPKTALILSDSFCRHLISVEHGHVECVGGGRCSTLAARAQDLPVEDFGIIVIQCGNNDAKRVGPTPAATNAKYDREIDAMRGLVQGLLSLPNRPTVVLSGALPTPGAIRVDDFNAKMQTAFGQMANLHFINLSQRRALLLDGTGQFDHNLLVSEHASNLDDNFHLGPTGFRLLWDQRCLAARHLESVSYTINFTPHLRRKTAQSVNFDLQPFWYSETIQGLEHVV